MGQFIGRGLAAILGVTLLSVACSGSSKKSGTETPDVVCTANARTCDGLNIKVCNADGTAESIEETCLPSQTCSNGLCQDNACVPNTKFCQDGAVWKCDSTGSGSSLSANCPTGQFCRDEDGAAYCSNQACTPGMTMCDGNVAATCQMDGSGPAPGGTDCAAKKQGCVNGACKDLACMPGSKLCQNGDVYLCAQTGTETSLLQDCTMGQVCDGDKAACVPSVCTPGQVSCDPSAPHVVTCNEFGSAFVNPPTQDCAKDDQICVGGTCKKQVCNAYSYTCKDGNIYQCSSDGTSSNLTQSCSPQYSHCQEGYQYCITNDCQPGQVLCDYNSNTVKTCTADGTLPPTGMDCGNDNYCDAGACKKKVCEPYTYYCKDGDIYYCNYYGGPQPGEQAVQYCSADTTCRVDNNQPACVPLPCSASETSCLANQIGTCADDGNSLGSVTSDCASAGNVCTADFKCAKTSVETVAIAEDATTEYAGNFIGNVIQVRSARKLTELQANLILASPRELRWVVYEQSGQIFQARVDKVISNQTGTGFISSGALNYTLKAGKTYVLGVAVSGGNFISYYDGAPFQAWVSFGSLLGRTDQGYAAQLSAYIDTTVAYQMKVTTELP